ncbi:DUF3298 domain-containing protein [Paenibacillus sp. HJGM_3]|uniref:DUF3298 and DUF4163 domain-containing protein n=1 Tax=Paenibacillus sp. HJGM_3 TaxID=3379816 RepID=UPI00385BD287
MPLYQLPVAVQTRLLTAPGVRIEYPSVTGLASQASEDSINRTIYKAVHTLQQQQQKVQTGSNMQMTGHYEIKTNERGLLSLLLSNYAYSYPMAHGNTFARSFTFDVNTGKLYSLADLFKPGANYVETLSRDIAGQLRQRNLPLLHGFHAIKPDQDYYLADKALVLYFQLYEITPYYVGMPMFPISVYDLLALAPDSSPLSKLAVDVV